MSDISLSEMVLAADIPARLVQDISDAKDSVHLQSMNFELSNQMRNVITAALDAASRGVKVTFAFDTLAFVEPHGKLLRNTLPQLEAAGITIKLLGGSLFPLKVAGRSHTKVYVVDTISYFGGGVNLYEPSFGYYDFMLRSTDDTLLLQKLHELIKRQPSDSSDWSMDLGNGDKMLVDGGKRNQSLIFDEAIRLVMFAKKTWYVSQFSPGRKLERALKRLSRDSCKVWFNVVASSDVRDKWSAFIDNVTSRIGNRYKGIRRIHAKFIVIQKDDGSYAAITGSHNFSDWGVRFGTKEAALYTTDQTLCIQLIAFAESLDQ